MIFRVPSRWRHHLPTLASTFIVPAAIPSHTFGQSCSLDLKEISPRKRPRSPSLSPTLATTSSTLAHTVASPPQSPRVSKKLKLHTSIFDTSPFPTFVHPTPDEVREVHDLLLAAHRPHEPIRRRPLNSNNSAGTCGNVPIVIEALIGTILSQNTFGQNCHRAKTSLDTSFGRNNFAAITEASRDRLVDTRPSGGLANKKGATIQNFLHHPRQARRVFVAASRCRREQRSAAVRR